MKTSSRKKKRQEFLNNLQSLGVKKCASFFICFFTESFKKAQVSEKKNLNYYAKNNKYGKIRVNIRDGFSLKSSMTV
jgi:hypothetical protein